MFLKKIFAGLTAILMTAALLAGCKNDTSEGSSEDINSTSSNIEVKLPETDEEWHQAMINKSLTSYGNTTRMMNKVKSAQDGQEVTIAYIGGSITEGLTAGAEDCYAKLSYNYFADKFGNGENIKYVNAGLSGTPSRLGVLRLNRDVLQYNPDIVFIEFAVNDGNDATYQDAYESMVRNLLQNDKDIAVVLLMSITENGHTSQEYMKTIGEHYELPVISYADSLTYMFENNKMAWGDFSDDQSHPNKDGHKLVCEMIENYYNTISEQTQEEEKPFPAPFYTSRQEKASLFENTELVPESLGSFSEGSSTAGFKNGWTYSNDGNNQPIVFKSVSGAFVNLIFRENSSGNLGIAHVTIKDGDEIVDEIDVNGIQPSGWGNPGIFSLVMNVEVKEYTIEIKMAEGSEDKAFEILAFAVTE